MFVSSEDRISWRPYNSASKIPALRIFGLSIAVCVVLNFVFVLTIFPAAIAMHRAVTRLLRPPAAWTAAPPRIGWGAAARAPSTAWPGNAAS